MLVIAQQAVEKKGWKNHDWARTGLVSLSIEPIARSADA